MPEINADKRGIAIFLVLGALIMAVVLARVVLNIILNQASLGRHQQSRVQAYYAAQAGMNYALEMLRTGSWVFTSCTNAAPCYVNEDDFPTSILYFGTNSSHKQFRIIFCPKDQACANSTTCSPPTGYTHCINSTVKYTAPSIAP